MGRINRDSLPAFPAGCHHEQFRHGQGRPLFDIANLAFPVPTAELPSLHGVLKDGFEETVVARHLQSVIIEEV